MANEEEIIQAVFIGIAVASVLLQTCRYSKAIELFSECLVLLKENSSKLKEDTLSKLYALVYHRLFDLYCLVGDHKKAIESGEAFSTTCKYYDCGFERAAALFEKIGDLYQLIGEQVKAKERYQMALAFYSMMSMMFNLNGTPVIDKPKEHFNKMLVLATKTGDKEKEGWLLNQLGSLALSCFEYSNAKEYFQKQLAISKETCNRKEEGRALLCLGHLYGKTEEYQQGKGRYKEAIAILEMIGEEKVLGEAYNGLGRVCRILGEFQQAKTLQKKALEISVKTGDKEGEIKHYRFLAGACQCLKEFDEAKTYYQKALTISKEVGDREGEALTYTDLGSFYRDVNDFKKAETYCKKACRIYNEIRDLPSEAEENSWLGQIYRFLGKYEEARKSHERALAIKKEIGDRRGEGQEYCNLGTVYQSLGDNSKAKKCHEQALAISKETNHLRGQGVDYGNLGSVCQDLGDYNKAYEYHKKALEIRLRIGHREGLPTAYNHLGIVCQHIGEYVKAEKFHKKALAAANEIGDRIVKVAVLSSLASLQRNIGEHEEAKALYEEALQISKEVGDVKQEARMNGNLGNVYYSLGDLTKAKKLHEKSLAIMKQIGCKDGESTALGNLGSLHDSLGEYTQARDLYEKALEISRETLDLKGEMAMINNLGTLHLSQNECQKALECFEKALGICEQTRDLHGKSTSCCHIAVVYMRWENTPLALLYLSSGIDCLEKLRVSIGESEYHKMGFADENAGPYRLMITFLLKLECLDKALSISELARARSLAELMASQYSCEQVPPFDADQWNDFENVIQTKHSTCLSYFFVVNHLFCWILKPISGLEAVTKRGLSTDIRPQGASLQVWLESLANECVRKFLLLPEERCEDRSLFLWDEHTESRSPSKVEEGPPTSQTKEPRQQQQQQDGKEPQALRDLYKLIVTPVKKFLKGSEVIIVPDRSLYRVPFAALKDENGEYLSEKFRIRFVPSLTTLKLIQDSPAHYHSQTGALIVGDPEVGLVFLKGRLKEISPLPCARKEAEMIGRLLGVQPLIGQQATKQAVLERINSVSLVHFAAHGDAERGEIALAPPRPVINIPEEEDYILTMSDISQAQLRAKLVVLSCCHSARGQIKAEGVVGIARAFLGSGARSVLVSLWAVDDIATMQFMKQFYGDLVGGKSASESLHETMKWMRGSPEYHEVREWAPFMLIGDDVSFDFSK